VTGFGVKGTAPNVGQIAQGGSNHPPLAHRNSVRWIFKAPRNHLSGLDRGAEFGTAPDHGTESMSIPSKSSETQVLVAI
jgi:hypothetical protein